MSGIGAMSATAWLLLIAASVVVTVAGTLVATYLIDHTATEIAAPATTWIRTQLAKAIAWQRAYYPLRTNTAA